MIGVFSNLEGYPHKNINIKIKFGETKDLNPIRPGPFQLTVRPGKTPPAVDMIIFYTPYLRYIYLKPPCKVSAL